MFNLYKLARPLIFKMDAEKAHGLTIKALKSGALPACKIVRDDALLQSLWGLNFNNPVGLAAGFDKNAEAIEGISKMGFGFIEVGTVTPLPQDGNPKPRIFRAPKHEAIINRMGFPNGGLDIFKTNLAATTRKDKIIGINIGMNKAQTNPAADYTTLIHALAPMADYITINISSPNTPGLRDLQSRAPLLALITAIKQALATTCGQNTPPLLVKLAPDLNEDQQKEMAQVATESGINGLILGNTTLDRPEFLPDDFRAQPGGLSGQPLTAKSTQIIHNFYALTNGAIPIIGVGGISNGAEAYAKIKAGSSLVQLYSALVYKGPTLINTINTQLLELLKADGHTNITQAIGADHG